MWICWPGYTDVKRHTLRLNRDVCLFLHILLFTAAIVEFHYAVVLLRILVLIQYLIEHGRHLRIAEHEINRNHIQAFGYAKHQRKNA